MILAKNIKNSGQLLGLQIGAKRLQIGAGNTNRGKGITNQGRFWDYKLDQGWITNQAAFEVTNWGKNVTNRRRDYKSGQKDHKSGQGLQIGAEQRHHV